VSNLDIQKKYDGALDVIVGAVQRIARLEIALGELVACKDLKEQAEGVGGGGHNNLAYEEYRRRQPLAWKAARDAMKDSTNDQVLVAASDAIKASEYAESHAHALDQAGYADYPALVSIREVGKRLEAAGRSLLGKKS
jgi:hypothetical protein